MNPLNFNLPNFTETTSFNLGQYLPDFSENILWGAVALLAIVIGAVTLVLYYHWFRYGFGDKMVIFAQVLYTIVALASFIVMISAMNYYV